MWQSGGGSAPGVGGGGANITTISSEGRSNTIGHHNHHHDSSGGVLDTINTNIQGDILVYDSHSDSGFLSGSNLMSSSSIDEYTNSSSNNISNMPSTISATSPHIHPDITSTTNNLLTSSGCLDSGIDISEQLSSLQLISGPLPYEESNTSVSGGGGSSGGGSGSVDRRVTEDISVAEDATTNSNSTLPISRSHVTLLREIFSPDKDGDT